MADEKKKRIFEEFKDMIKTETVVGEAMYIGDTVIIPFIDVTFGFGEGETGGKIGGGGRLHPTAVLIMKGERVELFSIKNASANNTVDRLLNFIPEVMSHFSDKKAKKEEIREAALKEAKKAIEEEEEKARMEESIQDNKDESKTSSIDSRA
jgi:hypothetical protein